MGLIILMLVNNHEINRKNVYFFIFQLAFAFWLMRYIFTVVTFILGIKAPGIRQEYNSRTPILDEETPLENEPRVSASQGSTWRNIWKKITTLLPFMLPKESVGLQLRVVMCIMLRDHS